MYVCIHTHVNEYNDMPICLPIQVYITVYPSITFITYIHYVLPIIIYYTHLLSIIYTHISSITHLYYIPMYFLYKDDVVNQIRSSTFNSVYRDEAILHCTILYCTVLHYTMLCFTTLYYTILCYTMLYYTVLYYTMLFICYAIV